MIFPWVRKAWGDGYRQATLNYAVPSSPFYAYPVCPECRAVTTNDRKVKMDDMIDVRIEAMNLAYKLYAASHPSPDEMMRYADEFSEFIKHGTRKMDDKEIHKAAADYAARIWKGAKYQTFHPSLIHAMDLAVDALEYVRRHSPDLHGDGVRCEALAALRSALDAVKLVEAK